MPLIEGKKLNSGGEQAVFPVAADGNSFPITGTVTATGAALETTLQEVNAHVHSIDSHIPVQGVASASACLPVCLSTEDVDDLHDIASHLSSIDSHLPAQGVAAASACVPVCFSVEDVADIHNIETHVGNIDGKLPAALGATSASASLSVGLSLEDASKISDLEGHAGSIDGKLPASLGIKAAAASLSVTQATEDAARFPASLGSKADAASFPVTQSTEDKAVLAAMSAKLPASLGIKAAAASLSVTQATEDAARFPASLGSKADAASFPVTQSTEDKAVLAALSGKLVAAAALADAAAIPTTTKVGAVGLVYNGSTLDLTRSAIVAPQTAKTGMQNTIPTIVYNAAAPTATDGQVGALQGDANLNLKAREQYQPVAEDNTNGIIAVLDKPVAVSTYAPTNVDSTALEGGHVIKASAGNLYALHVVNTDTTMGYFVQLHNAASAPADTAVPVWVGSVAAAGPSGGTEFNHDWPMGRYFSTGIYACISTAAATKVIGGNVAWIDGDCK